MRTCIGCGSDLPIRIGPGRPRLYCNDICRRAVYAIREPVRPATPRRKSKRRLPYNPRSVYNYGNARALDPDETAELRRRRQEGWRLEHLAEAYGVSVRTINRYLAVPPPEVVEIGGWRAHFIISHRDHPLQVTAWYPVEEKAS